MKLTNARVKVGLIVIGVLLIGGLAGSLSTFLSGRNSSVRTDILARATDAFFLARPVLAQVTGATFLDAEAGISIYTNIGQSANLSIVKSVFKTIEKETSDYIVGSIALPNLLESDDVHGFVHKDGWIVAYYLKAEPVSKIIDWNYYSAAKLTKTKLQVGLEQVTSRLGVTATTLNYYHFQYPSAKKWMIIVESQQGSGTDTFNLKIPSEFTVYERSWSHYIDDPSYSLYFQLDGNTISSLSGGPKTAYGQLTGSQLSPDVFHTVIVYNYRTNYKAHVGIVLVYLEP